jgi:hypothetical protein
LHYHVLFQKQPEKVALVLGRVVSLFFPSLTKLMSGGRPGSL